MQAVQIELFPKSREEQEQELFLSILHHDVCKRGGFFSRMDIKEDADGEVEVKQRWSTKNAYRLMTTDDSYNRYIAINTFHNIKEECVIVVNGQEQTVTKGIHRRHRDYLHAISTVYLDLDFHDGIMDEIQERVRNTKEFLNTAYKEGSLPRPTMVTETGRGLGVFYVLERSVANVKGAKKQIRFWDYICREFAKKYKEQLSVSDKPQLGIDPAVVGEVTRVVRLPGTKNLKSQTTCRLISVARKADGSPLYYTLNDLIQYVENYKVYDTPYKETRKKIARKKIVNLRAYNKPYLLARLSKLERAQDLYRDEREGHRELLCFLYFNTAKQIMDEKEAMERLLAFNNAFTYPLESLAELENIVTAVNKAKNVVSGEIQGFYEYKDETIRDLLDLTDAQNEYVGFGISLKELERQKKKEENQKAKKERNESIIAYVIEHTEATYEEIAGLFGVSVRTLKGILKKEGVYRYQKQVSETSICDAENKELENTKDNIVNIEEHINNTPKKGSGICRKSKVQKNALVSFCVVSPPVYNNTNNTSMPIKHKGTILHKDGDGIYTSKELKRIRGIPALEDKDGWIHGDFSWVFE